MLTRTKMFTCWKCTKTYTGATDENHTCQRPFKLVSAIAEPTGEVYLCWECTECGTLVPMDTAGRYIRNKEIILRKQKKVTR